MTLASGITIPLDQIAAICHKYHVSEMAIFGSAARGELRPDSDIDIMVEFLPGQHPGIGFFQLEDDLAGLFGRKVDVGRKSLLKPRALPSAMRDAVVVYAA